MKYVLIPSWSCGICKIHKEKDYFFYDDFLKKRIRICTSCYEEVHNRNKKLSIEDLLIKRLTNRLPKKFKHLLPEKEILAEYLIKTFDGEIEDLYHPYRYSIDHIIPVWCYDLNDKIDFLKCNHLGNLRIIESKENNLKRNKIIEDLIFDLTLENLLP
jgi:hypothetical protein